MNEQIPESQAAQIREFVFAGRKIEAIKLLRQTAGLQLVDAKTVVEKLEKELRETSPEKFSGKSGNGCFVRTGVFLAALLIVLLAAHAWGASRAGPYLKKDDGWFGGEEGRRVAENILSWQSELGSWPKNVDTANAPYAGERSKLKGTFDNSATCDEIRFLGRAYLATKEEKYRVAAIRGIDHIMIAQYENGGW